jgi:hypothetical protein
MRAGSPAGATPAVLDPRDIVEVVPADGIPAIDDPKFIEPSEAEWLGDQEPVIAVELDGEARAYPLQVMTWHEIVNDTIGETPVVFFDRDGNEIYSKRRWMDGRTPKYDNPAGVSKPDLYAAPGAWDARRVGLTEGEFDALVATQAGTSSFAAGGSSLSAGALRVLREKDEVVLIPDADDAGQRFLENAIRDLSGYVTIYEARLPE